MPDGLSEPGAHEVLIEGGPEGMPSMLRVQDGNITHLRLPHWNGLEHYEFCGVYRELEGRRLPVFQWKYATKFAE
jgi:hypothetical protein